MQPRRMLYSPCVHGDPRGNTHVDGPGGTELSDVQDLRAGILHLAREPRTFLTEGEDTTFRHESGFDPGRPLHDVYSDERKPMEGCVFEEARDRLMVVDVLVAIGNHCTTPIPASFTDDVHGVRKEGVRVAYDGADVEVVLPILDHDVERMPTCVEIRNDRLAGPVPIFIGHVPPIAVCEEVAVESFVCGPRLGVWSYADLTIIRHGIRLRSPTYVRVL